MNRFRKIFHHIKSDKIDEKIKSLDKEMERTGMVLGEVTMPMSTDNLYKIFNYANTPAVDQETSTVPDSTGFADGSSQDVNGGDESDSSTWDTGWNNTNDMSNPNELNGETDRPIPITPDLSGWDGSGVSANGNTGLGDYRGIGVWTISSGIGGGKSIGTLDSGNHFIQILVPDNIFSSYNYPVDQRGPLAGGSYGSYTNTEFAAAVNIAEAYEAKKGLGSVSRKVWVNYNQATEHGGPSYADYTGAKKTTTVNGHTKYWKLNSFVSILSYVNPYTSQDATPEIFSQVLDREYGVGSSYFPGNVSKLMDFLMGSLEVGKEALDFLTDKSKEKEEEEKKEKEEKEKQKAQIKKEKEKQKAQKEKEKEKENQRIRKEAEKENKRLKTEIEKEDQKVGKEIEKEKQVLKQDIARANQLSASARNNKLSSDDSDDSDEQQQSQGFLEKVASQLKSWFEGTTQKIGDWYLDNFADGGTDVYDVAGYNNAIDGFNMFVGNVANTVGAVLNAIVKSRPVGELIAKSLSQPGAPVTYEMIKEELSGYTSAVGKIVNNIKIAKSIFNGKVTNYVPNSAEFKNFAKNITVDMFQGEGDPYSGGSKIIAISDTRYDYADDNIYVDANGKVHNNRDGIRSVRANQEYPVLKNHGKGYAQLIIPKDGGVPYLHYYDHNYHNLNSGDDAEVTPLKGMVDGKEVNFSIQELLSDITHLATLTKKVPLLGFNSKAIDAADKQIGELFKNLPNLPSFLGGGWPEGIHGSALTDFKIPYTSLPQDVQDMINNHPLSWTEERLSKMTVDELWDNLSFETAEDSKWFDDNFQQLMEKYHPEWWKNNEKLKEVFNRLGDITKEPGYTAAGDAAREYRDSIGETYNELFDNVEKEIPLPEGDYPEWDAQNDPDLKANREAVAKAWDFSEEKWKEAQPAMKAYKAHAATLERKGKMLGGTQAQIDELKRLESKMNDALVPWNKASDAWNALLEKGGKLLDVYQDKLRKERKPWDDVYKKQGEAKDKLRTERDEKIKEADKAYKATYTAGKGGKLLNGGDWIHPETGEVIPGMGTIRSGLEAERDQLSELMQGEEKGMGQTLVKEQKIWQWKTKYSDFGDGKSWNPNDATPSGSQGGTPSGEKIAKRKYVPPYVQDWDKIGPGGRNTAPDIGGNKPMKASLKRDKDYSLGAYVGGTASKKKKKKNNTMVSSYKPQGKLISEGWASPKHTDIDKDEKKRWFSEKDIKPEYPKENPPKMVNGYHPKLLPQLDTPIPYIKVKKKDLLRAHKLTKDEAQKWTSLIDTLNAYIMRNPNMLAYARERYPKSDPHLAALNYKMDMQLAAADEYIETRFPENKRLYGKLMQATKRSIDLTDPKTFKSRKGKMTSINKLMRVDYVMSEYDPTDKEVKNKRIKSNKKSIGRFFRKPKKKTKSDILKDKMAVLDKEMKKTMPEA